MTVLQVAKVATALPTTPAANTLYFVKNGNTVRQYITDASGVAYTVGPDEPIEPLMLLGVNNG